jgi:protein O-mannosyl-transferase
MSQRPRPKRPPPAPPRRPPGKRAINVAKAPSEYFCPPDAAPDGRSRYRAWLLCGLLLLAVFLVFGQTLGHGFVDYDDKEYVYNNPHVAGGLTAQGVGWAFTTSHGSMWGPLTWLSHMLDCQLYRLHPWGHHLTNVLLHAATTILLFLVLWRMTGKLWPSALVAALFAVHPLQVESVAWVAERKGLLSGLFFVLTLGAYVGYVHHRFSLVRYLAVVALFALGLMAKPMVVTLPFVLLLLDYWPLGRMAGGAKLPLSPPGSAGASSSRLWDKPFVRLPFVRLAVEKIPLFALLVASCAATPFTQGKAVASLDAIGLSSRIANALVSYAAYAGKFFYPLGLAVFYPHPQARLLPWRPASAFLILSAVSLAALVWRRRHPYLIVGWLWYLGMLVPVIGLVQLGGQAMADRYTYLPQIGLCIALAWGIAHVAGSSSGRRWVCGVAAALALGLLMTCAWRQTAFWRNSEALWRHTLACTSHNVIAQINLGNTLLDSGRVDEAIAYYQQALRIKSDSATAHYNLGSALAGSGRADEAVAHYQQALAIKPDYADAHINLGAALISRGEPSEAIRHYRRALEIEPECIEPRAILANLLNRQGRLDEAVQEYRTLLRLQCPTLAEAHCNLAIALQQGGKTDESLEHYREAVRLRSNLSDGWNNMAWIRATHPDRRFRNGREAVEFAGRALAAGGRRNVSMLDTLAAAYAEDGQFARAATTAKEAAALARKNQQTELLAELEKRAALFQSGRPYRDPKLASVH